jgi:hypothetical protein
MAISDNIVRIFVFISLIIAVGLATVALTTTTRSTHGYAPATVLADQTNGPRECC